MTIKHFLIGFTLLLGAFGLNAQTLNHPTVDSVKVIYKPSQGAAINLASIMAIPNGTVKLKNGSTAKHIYFKIQDVVSSTVYYQADYELSSAPVYATDGNKLFENSNGRIYISSGQSISVKPYSIKVQTADSLQNLSPVFTIIQ